MKSYNVFIAEAARDIPTTVEAPKKLGHLDHVEDRLLQAGDEGYGHAMKTLEGMHNALSGQPSDVKLGTKYDGAPSLVFGTNPENGKFFVATKSWQNAKPKINYTPEDIERNHGHAPGLVEKLRAALEHLPKVTPKKGVFQGDVMYNRGDVRTDGKNYSFTPNTLTYSSPVNSKEGKRIRNAQIGVAVHTGYEDDGSGTLAGHAPRFMPNIRQFSNHPDVHIVSTEMKAKPENYTDEQKAEYQKHMDAARQAYSQLHPDSHETVGRHREDMLTYINHEVRRNGTPNHRDFRQFVQDRAEKEIGKLKTASNINRRRDSLRARLDDIEKNKDHFKQILDLHGHLQRAKNVLIGAANHPDNLAYGHSIGGSPTGPEGTVVVDPRTNTIDKAVNRSEFSAANFAKNQGSSFTSEKP
jgi:hypothetical protein